MRSYVPMRPAGLRINVWEGGLAAVKLPVNPKTDELLGVHMLGRNAEEVINVFAMALQLGIPRKDLVKIVWAFPSLGYDVVRHVLA